MLTFEYKSVNANLENLPQQLKLRILYNTFLLKLTLSTRNDILFQINIIFYRDCFLIKTKKPSFMHFVLRFRK